MILLTNFKFLCFLFLLTVVLYCVSSSDAEDELEPRKELVRRKQSHHSKRDSMKFEASTSKIGTKAVNKENTNEEVNNEEPTNSASSKTEETVANNSLTKKIKKRQQTTQAKPLLQPNRRIDPKKRVESCPLCDSSVFSYCSDKLLHDACCCLNPFENNLPYQCQYADCSFLHANSCREHHLITSCCCDRFIYRL